MNKHDGKNVKIFHFERHELHDNAHGLQQNNNKLNKDGKPLKS